MRKYLLVFCAILAYLLFCSKSCESPRQEDTGLQEIKLTKIRDSIKNEFESEYLSKKALRAFEVKAKEKIVDFSDYLNIYMDKSMDETLKSQSGKMILGLFISDSAQIEIRPLNRIHEKLMTIEAFLTSDSSFANDSIHFQFDSIEVEKPLHRIDESGYAGTLKFLQTVKVYSSPDSSSTDTAEKKAEMFVVKVKKPFGADTLQIWRVFLGNIQ
jgi:hypothetical protein